MVWDKPDAANDTIFIGSGDSDAVQVYGPGSVPDSFGWVNDTNGGVSYIVLTAQSSPGNVLIHVAPTASFTADGTSHDDPDLYISLPNASLNVVLTSDNVQDPDPTKVTANWTGSFSAAAPELQNVAVTQPTTVSALGDDASNDNDPDPVTADNAVITFEWRGLDPASTHVSLYYDYSTSGYSGTYITTVTGDDLTVSDPDGDGWRKIAVPWDIGDLEPAKSMYVYAVIKDDGHAASKSDYVGQVQTVPAAQIQVSYAGGTNVPATELQDIMLTVTPVKQVNITSISAGVVTVAEVTGVTVGDPFMFSGLTSAVGVQNTMIYYVLDINGETFTFSNVAAGAPLNEASAGQGSAYVDQDVARIYSTNPSGVVWPHVDVNQAHRFAMSPPRNVFAAAPASGQEVSTVGELIQYNTFVGNNQLLRMSYQFKVLAAIAGTVYSDLSDNGQLDSMDPGLAGAIVFLDDNNNGVLDPGEPYVVTSPDGNYLFVHQWADTDTPTSTYTTWVKVIPPAAWKITSSPSIPSAGITFTNNGNAQSALAYYNFMVASPITVGGIVYADANVNGVRDPGEKGLPGVSVSVVSASGLTIAATTDDTGMWQATSYDRGAYNVSVSLPSDGSFTTATSTSFTSNAATNVVFQNGSTSAPYVQNGVASQWNPATNSYSAWIAALATIQTYDGDPRIDFANIGTSPTGGVSVVNTYMVIADVASRFDAFIGKWSADGTPSLAVTYIVIGDGGGRGTQLSITQSTNAGMEEFPAQGGPLDALYGLSYDSTRANYSTVASIDNTGQVTLWNFDPSKLGNTYLGPAFTPGDQTFKLSQGTPVKLVGFNKAGSDHFQSQDLAVVYRDVNGVLALAEMNHATTAITIYAIGGRVFVDMIAGDFDGNGHEDVAVITADTNSQRYYLNVLLSQDDGSTDLIPYVGNDLAIATDGTPRTTLSSIRVKGDEQALLWNTQSADSSTKSISAVLVTGGQIRLSSGPASLTGRIAAINAGDIGKPATFAIYSFDMVATSNVPVATGTVQANADGKIVVTEDLTQYGGFFSGFDVGVAGVNPVANNNVSARSFRGDASCGVSSGTTYTHALNFNGTETVTINGIAFAAAGYGSDTGPFQVDAFDPATNTSGVMGGFQGEESLSGVTDNFREITGSGLYCYSGPTGVQRIILCGLTLGQTYTTGFYYVGRGNPGTRVITLTDSQGGEYTFDANDVGDQQGGSVSRTFTAASESITYVFTPKDTNDVYVNYALTNSVWVPTTRGTVYNDANSNGMQDPGETGLAGITVRLIDPNNATQTSVTSDGTDGELVGSYSFENVPTGAYIQVTLPPGTWTAENPPPGVPTNSNGSHGIVTGVTFSGGQAVGTIPFTDENDNAFSVAIKSADLQSSGQENLVIRTSSALFVQRFQADGTSAVDRYDVSSPAAYERPELYLEDLDGDGRIDIVTAGQSGVDVFINIGLGEFRPFTGLLSDKLTNSPAGSYGVARGFTNDLESGVMSAKTYTHALNFGGNDIAVNGVTFHGVQTNGSNFTLTATDPRTGATDALVPFPDFAILLTGNFGTMAQSSYQSPTSIRGTEQLTLTGLTPGVTYTTSFYTCGNNGATHRIQTVVDSLGEALTFDANGGQNLNGYLVSRTFTATSTSIVFTFFAQDPDFSFNLIALTNEVAAIGYTSPTTFTKDEDSGIGTDYCTHRLDFAATTPPTIETMTFTAAGQSGPNWVLNAYDPNTKATSAMLTVNNFNSNLTGGVHSLISNFYYSPVAGEQLTLTGLAVGAKYITTWYGAGFQAGIQRVATITDTLGGSIVVDENLFDAGNGIEFSRTFRATNDTITFTFIAASAGTTFHQYGLTNRLLLSGEYSYSGLTGDADSGINSSKTYTHILDWEASQQNTVNGVPFYGAARSDKNFSLVAIDPHTLEESEIDYFLNSKNNVTGGIHDAISNGYVASASKLVLSGLAPGTTYVTTFYTAAYGAAGTRQQTISDSEGGVYHFDENVTGDGNGFRVIYTYTASNDSITFYIVSDDLQNPFFHGALTNEVAAPTHRSPFAYGTALTVVAATSVNPATIYAAQQNTQVIYELAWNSGTATLAPTGQFFPLDHVVRRFTAGSVANDGELDLVVYEDSNDDPDNPLGPGSAAFQKLWLYTSADSYTTGALLKDFGRSFYGARVGLLLAPLFAGVQTVVLMAPHNAGSPTDIVTYRSGSGINTTTIAEEGYSLGVGQFVPGSRTPNILLVAYNSMIVLDSGNDPTDLTNPNGPDPSVPLVILGRTYMPNNWNAAAVGASFTTHSDDLMVVTYNQASGFTVLPYFNITGGYQISSDATGSLYDFPVVVPGSAGGTINGNVFMDPDSSGKWDANDQGLTKTSPFTLT